MAEENTRIDAEWVAVNAFRELAKIASKGDVSKVYAKLYYEYAVAKSEDTVIIYAQEFEL